MTFKQHYKNFLLCLLCTLVVGCSSTGTTINSNQAPHVNRHARWAMFPIANHTELPLANKRIASITTALLRSKGVRHLRVYHVRTSTEDMLLNPNKTIPQATLVAWAKRHHIHYAVSGSVNEWRYRNGNDNEPAVGLTLELIDVQNGTIPWSVAISDTGLPRQSVSALAQRLIDVALNGLLRR